MAEKQEKQMMEITTNGWIYVIFLLFFNFVAARVYKWYLANKKRYMIGMPTWVMVFTVASFNVIEFLIRDRDLDTLAIVVLGGTMVYGSLYVMAPLFLGMTGTNILMMCGVAVGVVVLGRVLPEMDWTTTQTQEREET